VIERPSILSQSLNRRVGGNGNYQLPEGRNTMKHANRLLTMALVGLLFSLQAIGDEVAPKRPLLPEDIAAIRWVASPAVSPSGQQVAYLVIEWEQSSQAERKSTLWLASTDGSQPPRAVAAEHHRVGAA
jgi:hypothetical protein